MYNYDGYLELAATNDIILVYPESHCWNAGGNVEQAEGAYLTKDGLYPKAFMAMICRLTSASEETSNCPKHSEEYEHQVFADWLLEEYQNWMHATTLATTGALAVSLMLLQ